MGRIDANFSGIVGLGKKRLEALAERGIADGWDLLLTLPTGYIDTTCPTPIAELQEGQSYAVCGTLPKPPSLHRVGGRQWVRARLEDETGSIPMLWFSLPWIREKLRVGEEYLLYGRVTRQKQGLMLVQPSLHDTGDIQAVYPAIPGIPPKIYRSVMAQMLQHLLPAVEETLPASLLERQGLMGRREALQIVHQPLDASSLLQAKRRLAFEELLCYQAALRDIGRYQAPGVRIDVEEGVEADFWTTLPFAPTAAQQRVLTEVVVDMAKDTAMARMIQGDVGCGKTAIAFGAMALCARAGYQAALMAPTEVLAQQHHKNAQKMLEPLGIRCGLLTGKLTAAERREAHRAIASGDWQVAIGTHALITEEVAYRNLGLVVTDEQHRFGVRQRSLLTEKGDSPNVLVLSATPIPRSLALVLYGDLAISVVDELPPGRQPVKTHLVPAQKRADMLGFLRREVAGGAQVYFVCPLVEDSEAMEEVASAESLTEQLQKKDLPELRIGCVHGRMKSDEKESVLSDFREGRLDVLVSTTVIEVGVDVPNASVMVIEDAFRFGLSQLHQLRGRVGRGERQSYCFLLSDPNERLKTLTACHDGFVIAQKDLELRGAGDFFGTRQHGQMLESGLLRGSDAALLAETQQVLEAYREDASLREEAEMVFAHAKRIMADRMQTLARN